MDKEIEAKQWEICPFCGAQKVPDERVVKKFIQYGNTEAVARQRVANPKQGYNVCPNAECATLTKHSACLRMPFIDGAYYHGICRCARIARYVAVTNRFVYMREKFGSVFPEGIGHAENDNGFDLFQPYGVLENPPFEIPQQER